MEKNNMVLCPLIQKYISESDCFETGTVAERLVNVNSPVGVKEIKAVPDFHNRCVQCEKHIV